MKCKMRVLELVLCILIVTTSTVFATVGSRTAELFYNNIKIMLNGKEVVPTDANGNSVEPFVIEGTTYLPVRAVANALGMNVGWNDETKTVTLENPGVFTGAVQVYDDEFVTIEFAGSRAPDEYDIWGYYYIDFNIKNKTDVELEFQPGAISMNGISYQVGGSEEVAPQSTGKVSFYTDVVLPTGGVSVTSGQVKVIDFDYSENKLFDSYSYSAKWVNVTNQQ